MAQHAASSHLQPSCCPLYSVVCCTPGLLPCTVSEKSHLNLLPHDQSYTLISCSSTTGSFVCARVCVFACVRVCACLRMYVCMHVRVCAFVCACVCDQNEGKTKACRSDESIQQEPAACTTSGSCKVRCRATRVPARACAHGLHQCLGLRRWSGAQAPGAPVTQCTLFAADQ